MNIKRVVAKTEREAVEKIKRTCGDDALILNIQKRQSTGVLGFLKKPVVIVTAAYSERKKEDKTQGLLKEEIEVKPSNLENEVVVNEVISEEEQLKNTNEDVQQIVNATYESNTSEMETKSNVDKDTKEDSTNSKVDLQQDRIKYLENNLFEMSKMLTVGQFTENKERMFESSVLQIFYEALVAQGVLDYVAKDILSKVLETVDDEHTLDISIVAAKVYGTILDAIKNPVPISGGDSAVFVFFVGPTGVGKTTTIAKLASRLVLEQNIKVGLITADTYRIAAVEQLKVYAEILNLDIDVIYEKQDFIDSTERMLLSKDVVFVDTAGRSHKNKENLLDLKELVSVNVKNEKYLVLSMTTKYEDLINIIDTYNDIGDIKLILTKFDETTHYGSVLNLCHTLGLEVVYITTGQNVPDDIEILQPEKIAKALLGLNTGL